MLPLPSVGAVEPYILAILSILFPVVFQAYILIILSILFKREL